MLQAVASNRPPQTTKHFSLQVGLGEVEEEVEEAVVELTCLLRFSLGKVLAFPKEGLSVVCKATAWLLLSRASTMICTRVRVRVRWG